MNPFEYNSPIQDEKYYSWEKIYPIPYDKKTTSPYTKTRVILMDGCATEQVFFLHQFHRNCKDNNLRRRLAELRRIEQQQQKRIQCLKPIDENVLEETIIYELLAVDLTARMAQCEPDKYVKDALDFALLEDFDHLYRYSNLMKLEYKKSAEYLVGQYTELTPGRPTISHHRHPEDTVRRPIGKDASTITKLFCNIITAAEQQTMNFYMNVCNLYPSDLGRRLYQEIGMVEEDHVTHYGSLLDPSLTFLENLVMHMYVACYLYYSCLQDESNAQAKKVWEDCFNQEVANLKKSAKLLEEYENNHWSSVIPEATFPTLLNLGPNVEYIREILKNTVRNTALKEDYVSIDQMPLDSCFFFYQSVVNDNIHQELGHKVIMSMINTTGMDYRYEKRPNPRIELRKRNEDNYTLGRVPNSSNYSDENNNGNMVNC